MIHLNAGNGGRHGVVRWCWHVSQSFRRRSAKGSMNGTGVTISVPQRCRRSSSVAPPQSSPWFDPFGWLAHHVPGAWLHRSIRGAASLVLGGFLVLRVGEYCQLTLKPPWAVETLLFAVLLGVQLRRARWEKEN